MKNKTIIIDGVDVAECEFLIINNDKQLCRCIKSDLFGGIEFVENAKNANCKDNSNCYYKQLKHKKKECKKLKKLSCKFKEYCTCNTEKFLQTLKYIKQIAEQECDYCKRFNDDGCYKFCNYNKILRKIKEIENET